MLQSKVVGKTGGKKKLHGKSALEDNACYHFSK
jgi:hypothetical protein